MNHPKQLETHKVPTYYMENINNKEKGEDLLLIDKQRTLYWGTKRRLQGNQRHRRATVH